MSAFDYAVKSIVCSAIWPLSWSLGTVLAVWPKARR